MKLMAGGGFSARINREYPPLGSFIELDGTRLHYLCAGADDAPPLVLIHGASGNLRDWTSSVFERLAEDWRVIAVDRPGYGHSDELPRESWLIRPQTHALRHLMSELGHERYGVFGHSYGVAVALEWALLYPEEVIGIAAMSGAMVSWKGALGWRYRLGGYSLIGRLMGEAVPLIASDSLLRKELVEVFEPESVPETYLTDGAVALALKPRTFALNLRAMDTLHAQTALTIPQIPTISCPVEVLHGRDDAIVPYDAKSTPIAALAPGSETTILDCVGHMPHHTRPTDVIAATKRLRNRMNWSSIGAAPTCNSD
ncbi:MAG: alpha/beta hydrolase [Pseudomonadota bacterium]